MDSLTSRHSGISNDILLFSDIGLSLTHHYRVHKRGVPHVTFRRNYMSQLHALLPLLGVAPLVDPGTDCEDELPTPACPPAVVDQEMDSELQKVFIDVVSLPTMVTPVCDMDGTHRMPQAECPVVAPS